MAGHHGMGIVNRIAKKIFNGYPIGLDAAQELPSSRNFGEVGELPVIISSYT
jgi:hypothetical protein